MTTSITCTVLNPLLQGTMQCCIRLNAAVNACCVQFAGCRPILAWSIPCCKFLASLTKFDSRYTCVQAQMYGNATIPGSFAEQTSSCSAEQAAHSTICVVVAAVQYPISLDT